MDDHCATQAAEYLWARRQATGIVSPLPAHCRPAGLADAYEVQRALHRQGGGTGCLAGYKIGCTTKVMQAYISIDEPCAGGVFANTVHGSGAVLPMSAFVRPGVECELAVRLGADLPGAPGGYAVESVAPAVAGVMAAIEIVDDRYQDFATIGAPILVADDFFGAGVVLGGESSEWRPDGLAALSGAMTVNGTTLGSGRGADILGHPLAALAWLADLLAAQDRPLAAGMIVSLGSVVKVHWLAPGDVVDVVFDGLAPVSVTFAGSDD